MAVHDPTFTPRLFVQYEGPAGVHTLMYRFPRGTDPADGVAAAVVVCDAMSFLLTPDTEFTTARWANEDSDITFPVAWTPISGTSGDTMSPEEFPNFASWVGRDSGGVRVRWTLNGIPLNADGDYRVLASDSAQVAAVISALEDSDPHIVTVLGGQPFINPYMDTGRNSYFQRKRRRTA